MLATGFAGKESFGARLPRRPRLAPSCLALCGVLALTAVTLAQNATSQPVPKQPAPTAQPQPAHPQKGNETPPLAAEPAVPAVAPSLLEQPASPATVTAGNNELTVKADNSSLTQILRQVSSKLGMQLDGLSGDERVFGNFGPAAPREVLTALLDGTSYNVVMVGDLANGAPRELLLTRRTGGGATTPADTAQNQNQNSGQNAQNAQNGDDSTQDDTGNGDDSSDDGSPPMQYTPPSIAPAEPVPPAQQNQPNPQNPRVAPRMQSAPE